MAPALRVRRVYGSRTRAPQPTIDSITWLPVSAGRYRTRQLGLSVQQPTYSAPSRAAEPPRSVHIWTGPRESDAGPDHRARHAHHAGRSRQATRPADPALSLSANIVA